jgi:hypothetical protein
MYQQKGPYPQRRGPAQDRDCTSSIASGLTLRQQRRLKSDRDILRRYLRADRLADLDIVGCIQNGMRDPGRDLVELAPRVPAALARLVYVATAEWAA